ncbi:hypothetical protein ACFOEY_10930 [Paracandidimonas soli]|uniref:hypothetical protein n=1 Tax=Paracandidimonas soli TaxID=1917182 RepID=UPI00361F2C93
MTPMAEAVSLAKSAGENPDLPAVLLADVFDFHRLPRPCVPLDEIEHWRLKCGFLESGAFDLRFYVETDNVGDD